MSHIKTGAPRNDVIIPTGNSAGAMTTLAITSDTDKNIIPKNTDAGME